MLMLATHLHFGHLHSCTWICRTRCIRDSIRGIDIRKHGFMKSASWLSLPPAAVSKALTRRAVSRRICSMPKARASLSQHGQKGRSQKSSLNSEAEGEEKISPEMLLTDFQEVHFRADVLLERMKLEDGLLGFLATMPLFLLSLLCFLVAISILSPATETSAIHQHLEGHFQLQDVYAVKDVHGIYQFLQSFEEKNLELRPTSPNYWCEHRYFQYLWDDVHEIPVTKCESPRYTALSLQSAPLWSNDSAVVSAGPAYIACILVSFCQSRI